MPDWLHIINEMPYTFGMYYTLILFLICTYTLIVCYVYMALSYCLYADWFEINYSKTSLNGPLTVLNSCGPVREMVDL